MEVRLPTLKEIMKLELDNVWEKIVLTVIFYAPSFEKDIDLEILPATFPRYYDSLRDQKYGLEEQFNYSDMSPAGHG